MSDDFNPGCGCPGCDAPTKHKPDRCRRKAKWYLEVHCIDNCDTAEPRQMLVCQQCFESWVSLAVTVVAWGMAGHRSTTCLGCDAPLVRISNVIRDVGKV